MKSRPLPQATFTGPVSRFIWNMALLLAAAGGVWQLNRNPPVVHAASLSQQLRLNRARQITPVYKGSLRAVAAMTSGQATPLSLASDDFDVDGVDDLAAGFAVPGGGLLAIHRGNLDAFAPQSEASFQAIGRGEFPSPFLREAQLVEIPVQPDFLAAGDFIGINGPGMVAAARGGRSLYVLARGRSGNFEILQTLQLPGSVTAMSAYSLVPGKYWQAVLGVDGPDGPQLLIYTGSAAGLKALSHFTLTADATSFAFGNLDTDYLTDVLVLAGGRVSILHGASQTLEPLQIPYPIAAAAVGRFLFDRTSIHQMALLGNDGSVHIFAHEHIDSRPLRSADFQGRSRWKALHPDSSMAAPQLENTVAWREVENHSLPPTINPATSGPHLFHTRISNNAADDVMLFGSYGLAVLAHADAHPAKGEVINRADLAADAVAALPQRLNVSGKPGLVYLKRGDVRLQLTMPVDPTLFVNRSDDPAPTSPISSACTNTSNSDTSVSCSLREAVLRANADNAGDTIMIAAGTYTLSRAKIYHDFTGNQGTLEVKASVNIVGAGAGTTIIQAGTSSPATCIAAYPVPSPIPLLIKPVDVNYQVYTPYPNTSACTSVDKIFSFNQDINSSFCSTGNVPTNTPIQSDGTAAPALPFTVAAACAGDTLSNGTVTLSGVTLQNGFNRGNPTGDADGFGGAFDWDTGSAGTARLTITGCIIQNNLGFQGAGATFFNFTSPSINFNLADPTVTISNTTIQNNVANFVDPYFDMHELGEIGSGGGLAADVDTRLKLTNVQVLNNTATQIAESRNGINTFDWSAGSSGGLLLLGQISAIDAIHNSTISGNLGLSLAGGIDNTASLVIDTGTVISGNQAVEQGAGLDTNGGTNSTTHVSDTLTISNTTFLNNTLVACNTLSTTSLCNSLNAFSAITVVGGGAILQGNLSGAPPVTVEFSRFAGNTVGSGVGANILNRSTNITATDNWWDTNSSATISGTINNNNGTTGCSPCAATTTFDPFIVLSNTASPNKIRINQSTTLTADLAHDNHGASIASGNLTVLVGLPITFNNPVLGTIPNVQPETLDSNASATATFNAGGVGGNGAADATVDQQTTTASIIILQPPSISKSFSPTGVAENSPSTITFSVTNGNTVAIDGSFADTLPTNLVVATTPTVVNNCGGTVTATSGSGSISFSNTTLAAGTCNIMVNVQSAVDGVYNNSVTIDSTDAGNGNTASASLTVINPPSIAKAFGAATVPLNGTTSLTFTLSSTNTTQTLSGVAFTDTLPAGLVVATPNNLSNTCGGSPTAVAGSSSVSLSGVSLAPGTSCTVSLNVKGTTAGVKNNSVQATSTNGGTGNTSNTSITVVAPPTISKAFGAASVPLNGSTSLSFTIQNPNTTQSLSGVAFSDTLPAGLTVSTPNGLTGSCGSGTITATQATSVISLSGGTIAANGSCTFSVNVTGTTAGQLNNTTGAVTSTEGGTGAASNTTNIAVVAPPSMGKAFNPTSTGVNGTTTLTFTITNPAANTVAEAGVAFADTLPAGLVVATPNGLANTCGGTPAAVAGSTSISLTGGAVPVNSSCMVSVSVTATTTGQFTNTSGTVTSTNGGTGNTATANLTVVVPPSITKVFGAASIPNGSTTSLTFNISNPNSGVTLAGLAFTDNLPAGLVVASPPNLSSTCGGTPVAVAGAASVSLSGSSLAASAACTLSVNVQGTTGGIKNNSVQITSTNGGTGNTSSTSITVVGPPTISKAFGAATIPLNGSTSLSFTIQNANTTQSLSGVAFSDTLPAGLIISTPNGLTGSCGSGTMTATQATNVISLSGGTIAASGSCTFSVNVTGTTAGAKNNTSGAVSSTEGGAGTTSNTAGIAVVAPPSIAKGFNPSGASVNGTVQLTFTITNPPANTVAEAGVAFSDTLPSGVVVSTPNGLTDSCGGTATATAGSGSISLTGGTLAVNSNCTVAVNVTPTQNGSFTNTSSVVSSTNGGTGNTASATLTVAVPPSITKVFGAASIPNNGTTSLTFNITNPNAATALTGVGFTDNLPAGLVVAPTPNLNETCGGIATAVAGAGSVSLSGVSLAATAGCAVSVNVQGTTGGVKNNSVQVTSATAGVGNTSNASLTVVGPPAISKAFGAASIPLNGTTSLSFAIQNNNTTITLTGIGFTDALPAGLVVSTPNGLTGSCGGGTITATAGTGAISLSGASLAASGSCTFSVNVTGSAAGTKNNTTASVTSNEGGTGATASASIAVVAPPSIAKGFNPSGIAVNGVSTLTFTITNPAANTVAENGVAFTDNFPVNLVVATPNGLTNTCGGTPTATAGSGTVSLTGGTVAVNSNCSVTVNVTTAAAAVYTNVSGSVTSTNGGTGNTASAILNVANPPAISKAFGAAGIALNSTTSLTFTITNPNSTSGLTGLQFTDNFPAGLHVASPPGASDSCGGTLTAGTGSSSISLTGGAVAANSTCTVAVNVTATSPGIMNNTSGVISANESGPGAASNTATLTVTSPPAIAKAFSPNSISLNGTSTLTFTINNPAGNPVAFTGLTFTDTFPAGLVVSNAPNAVNNCGGTFTATAGSSSVNLTNGGLGAASSCSISVNVTATGGGNLVNRTGNITSSNAGTGNAATATLSVPTPITVTTSPAGLSFTVDGITYTSTQSFGWVPGSSHMISTTSPQPGPAGSQFAWTSWSNGGAISQTVIAPAATTTYTANFGTQFLLTVNVSPQDGGNVSPQTGFFDAGSSVKVTAKPSECFKFSGWMGPVVSPNSLSTSVNMTGPLSITATFAAILNCGGTPRDTLSLFANPVAGGTIMASPGPDASGSYAPGTLVKIQASANPGYLFIGFGGDLSGITSPQSLTINGNQSVVAYFAQIPIGPQGQFSGEDFDFAFQKGNPLPPPQTTPLDGSLLGTFPVSGGPWLQAAATTTGTKGTGQSTAAPVLTLSLDPTTVNALADGIYTSYVVTGSLPAPKVIQVRLLVDTLEIQKVTDSAGYRPLLVSADGLFSAFGLNLANQTASASSLPLTAALGGSKVIITDSSGTESSALLLYVSPSQINFLTPKTLSSGAATVSITNWAGLAATIPAIVADVAPGLFAADASGAGVAAAEILTIAADGTRTYRPAADCTTTPGKCMAVPIDVGGPGVQVFLSLYGTGIRGRSSLDQVAISIGGVPLTPLYAGPQSQFPGLDQIDMQLPQSLAGKGQLNVVVTVEGRTTNTVSIAFK